MLKFSITLSLPRFIFFCSFILLILTFTPLEKAQAQECLTGDGCLPNRGCVDDFQPESVCTANDVTIALLFVNDALPVCRYAGDTATVYLEAQIVAGSRERYDIGMFIAMDGGSALSPSRLPDGASCYHDYLRGPLSSSPTTTPPRTSPFIDLEDTAGSGDECGDLEQGVLNLYYLEPITILCKDDNNDGKVDDLSACVSWDNQRNGTPVCTSEMQAYPNTKSKCRCEYFPMELYIRDADLAVDKRAPANIGIGKTFNYDIVITNNGPDVADNVRFNGSDVIETGLSILSVTPDATNYDNAELPWCTITDDGNPATYDGGSVNCNIGDMAVGATYTVTIQVKLDPNTEPYTVFENTVCIRSLVDDPVSGNNCDTTTSTTPVTIAYFSASQQGDSLSFAWSTATQLGSAGFNLYADTPQGLLKLNDELIPSTEVDAFTPQSYSFSAPFIDSTSFFIEDVDVLGNTRLHGPFSLGLEYGSNPQTQPIPWEALRTEHLAKLNSRSASPAQPRTTSPSGFGASIPDSAFKVYLPLSIKLTSSALSYPTFDLLIDQDGIYRISYEDLLAAGLDLQGVPAGSLALLNQGLPVPMRLVSSLNFGPGAYFEFYGQALRSLYSRTNVYRLVVDPAKALRIPEEQALPAPDAPIAPFYMETVTVERNNKYGFAAPNEDPWFDFKMMAYTSPVSWDLSIPIEGYLPGAAPASFSIFVWGVTDWPKNDPDHHLLASFNGQPIANAFFNGQTSFTLHSQLPDGLLHEGDNTIQLTLPGDTGVSWDIINLDKYAVTYPRIFQARHGSLTFSASGQAFRVSGLTSPDVSVFRLQGNSLSALKTLTEASHDTFSATFAGSPDQATYFVFSQPLTPKAIQPARLDADLASGSYDFLIISHPDFLPESDPNFASQGLGRLIQARQAQGYAVKLVNVDDVYAQFGHGLFDPQAIKAYIKHAASRMGVRFVLLVGGDTYDYLNYTGQGSFSFIPSLYRGTGYLVNFAPVDPAFADLNDDNLPDLAIGRFPVRSSAELASIIEKTLLYQNIPYAHTAFFAADAFDGLVRYAADSNRFIEQLPSGWSASTAYLDELPLADARTLLINALNNGIALVSYVGHSSPTLWSYKGLFSSSDAANLTNANMPTVVTQWGCWTTYFVDPANNTLAHAFLLSGNRGAAAVLGATTLTFAPSEAKLGRLLMPYLTQPNMTIGEALLRAKHDLAVRYPHLVDVLLGWTILGDPTLMVAQ